MSDRIMVMNRGHIDQLGTPMNLYEDPATPFVADFIGQANLLQGKLASVDENGWGHFAVAGKELLARMGKQNPPAIGENALLVVRPENLTMNESDNAIAMRIVNRLFEGDRIDYHVVIEGSGQEKPFSMSVPFLPGTQIIDEGSTVNVSFNPQAGVIIRVNAFDVKRQDFRRLVASCYLFTFSSYPLVLLIRFSLTQSSTHSS